MQLNIEQRFYIVEHFFRTSSVKQTIRNFYSTFNRKIFPKTVKQTILRLRQTGSLHNRPKLGRPTVIDDALIEKIRQQRIPFVMLQVCLVTYQLGKIWQLIGHQDLQIYQLWIFSLGLRERINISRATKNYPGT